MIFADLCLQIFRNSWLKGHLRANLQWSASRWFVCINDAHPIFPGAKKAGLWNPERAAMMNEGHIFTAWTIVNSKLRWQYQSCFPAVGKFKRIYKWISFQPAPTNPGSPSENGKGTWILSEVIGHPNHHLWLDSYGAILECLVSSRSCQMLLDARRRKSRQKRRIQFGSCWRALVKSSTNNKTKARIKDRSSYVITVHCIMDFWHSQTLNVWYIYLYIYHTKQPNVGK